MLIPNFQSHSKFLNKEHEEKKQGGERSEYQFRPDRSSSLLTKVYAGLTITFPRASFETRSGLGKVFDFGPIELYPRSYSIQYGTYNLRRKPQMSV